jgi:protein O-GlcNAc transferase
MIDRATLFNEGISALNSRNIQKAEDCFRRILQSDQTDVPALNILTVILMTAGRFQEAKFIIEQAIALNQDSDVSFYNYGLIAKHLNEPQLAYKQFTKALSLNPNVAETWNNRGTVLNDLKRYDEAIFDFDQAAKLNSDYAGAYANKGKSLNLLMRYDEAVAAYNKALSIKPDLVEARLGRGNVLWNLKRNDRDFAAYDKALSVNADLESAWLGRGDACWSLKRYDEAFAAYDKALSIKPDLVEAWLGRGNVLWNLKRNDEALTAYDKALSIKPDLVEAWLGRGNVFTDLKRYDEALAACDKALSIKPDFEGAWLGRGNVCWSLKRYDEAFAAYDKALSIKPDLVEAWLGRGNVLWNLKRNDEALTAYDKALSIEPDLVEAWLGRGNVFTDLKGYDEAFAAYDKALSITPDLAEAWLGRGNVFNDLKRYDEALAAYDKALSITPDLEGAWLGRGNVFNDLKRYGEAFAAYDKALSIKPDLAEAWLGRGNVFNDFKRHDEALAAYDKALSIKPDLEDVWFGRGNVFTDLKRYDEALAAYDKALSIKPDLEGVEGARLHAKMQLFNWEQLETEINNLTASVRAGKACSSPFVVLSIIDLPDEHLRCAQAWVAAKHPQASKSTWPGSIYAHDKIRIGYVSADFRKHAIAILMAELFESHNRRMFTTTAFSFGLDDKSDMRQRLINSFDTFVDCRNLSDADVARTIANAEIDILVDLNGFTQDARTRIFSYRPAPIQVNYLGYPGTMAAPYIDYIIGDKTLFTLADATVYSEKLVQLPHSYQPNDRKRYISDKYFEREGFGLPKDKFVFCCFNSNCKILPSVFDSWMRILKHVDRSVLWLLVENQTAIANLRRGATSRGIHPARLVFANRMELSEHLARHRLADLFLDTLPYNAHTTASDALWAGLPVLTQIGNAFAGRVAASLLNAIDMPELITYSREEYEALAIELALNGEKLKAIKEKLARNRLTTRLFDTSLYAKHLEAAYEAMYQRYKAGLPPDHIEINA